MGDHNNGGLMSTSTTRTAHRGTPTMLPRTRPTIKIIHIIAPEIIKTDVAHFRDLVQRLTGKPACWAAASSSADATSTPPVGEEEMETSKKRSRPAPAAPVTDDERSDFTVQGEAAATKKRKIKCEVKVEEGGFFGGYELGGRSDLWMGLSTGGFLSFLEEEEEDVFQGLAADHDFLQPLGSSRMDLVGEMYTS